MIIPWQEINPDTLENIIKEFVLREGTDYGEVEYSLDQKIEHVRQLLIRKEVFILYSELHETIDIKNKKDIES